MKQARKHRVHRLVLVLVVCVLVGLTYSRYSGPVSGQGAAVVATLADITGDGSSHPLSSSGTARWIQIDCASGNSAAVRLGDSTVDSTHGTSCAAGGGFFYPPMSSGSNPLSYSLNQIYYRAASSDVLHVQIGR